MKTEEIQALWEVDGEINDIFLDTESTRTHKLHNKYFTILNDETKTLLSLQALHKALRIDKWEYYMGILDEEKLKKRGWLPCGLKILKSNVNTYLEADEELLNDNYKIGLQEQKTNFLKSIIDQINRRSFIIKNSIEFKKYTNGVA